MAPAEKNKTNTDPPQRCRWMVVFVASCGRAGAVVDGILRRTPLPEGAPCRIGIFLFPLILLLGPFLILDVSPCVFKEGPVLSSATEPPVHVRHPRPAGPPAGLCRFFPVNWTGAAAIPSVSAHAPLCTLLDFSIDQMTHAAFLAFSRDRAATRDNLFPNNLVLYQALSFLFSCASRFILQTLST